MRVFFTIDTEFGRRDVLDPEYDNFDIDIQRDIYGRTVSGEFGVRYQIDVLDAYGLKGVFFIEPLRFIVAGIEYLRDLIQLITSRGHYIELHSHTEWLQWLNPSPLPGKHVTYMRQLSYEDQCLLIRYGCSVLKDAGLTDSLRAFRAGNFGANNDTLRALAANNILIDTSYNYPYLNSACNILTSTVLLQPQLIDGVLEVPVNFYQDFPGHYRHTQITAISFTEMRSALESAFYQGWSSFVIVSHSFELIKRNRQLNKEAQPDLIVINRFEKLMEYLGKNKDKYTVDGFLDMDSVLTLTDGNVGSSKFEPIKGSIYNTAGRWIHQSLRRM